MSYDDVTMHSLEWGHKHNDELIFVADMSKEIKV